MGKRYQNKNDDIFDSADKLGCLAVKAHKAGGMPLVLAVVGIFFIVLFFVSIVIKLTTVWSVILIVFGMLSIGVAVYLYLNQNKMICPKCGKELVVKMNRKTKECFWGCSAWPKCKYTKDC